MPQEEHDAFTLLVEVLMVKPCGLTSELVVVELFPLESFSMKFCPSIDWGDRHTIDMCTLDGKYRDFVVRNFTPSSRHKLFL